MSQARADGHENTNCVVKQWRFGNCDFHLTQMLTGHVRRIVSGENLVTDPQNDDHHQPIAKVLAGSREIFEYFFVFSCVHRIFIFN
jgi:hypothetical protein